MQAFPWWAEPSITRTVTNLWVSKRLLWQFDVHFDRDGRPGFAGSSAVAPALYTPLLRRELF
jgi:hypothetical protein